MSKLKKYPTKRPRKDYTTEKASTETGVVEGLGAKGVKKPLLVILARRATIFLFSLDTLAIFLFAIGSFQSFLDDTMDNLLKVIWIASSFLAAASVFGVILRVGYAIAGLFRIDFPGVAGYLWTGFVALCGLAIAGFVTSLGTGF